MSVGKRALSALGKIGIVLAIGIAFLFGLAGTVYLSLRSAEVRVPDVVGKDRGAAEQALKEAGLKYRQTATRYSAEAQPNTILDQMPKAGEVIKVGQTVAVVMSRAAAREGEASTPPSTSENKPEAEKPKENQNTNQAANNQNNQNENQNKEKRNKNANNKNANNSNNRNANNRNANNVNNRNANRNTNANTPNANANANTNSNRSPDNSNANKRVPANISTPPFNPGSNMGTP